MKILLLLSCLIGIGLSAEPADKAEDYLSRTAEQADSLIDQTLGRMVYCWKKSMNHFHDGWNGIRGKTEDSLNQVKKTAENLPKKAWK